jgi:hypothetical protein
MPPTQIKLDNESEPRGLWVTERNKSARHRRLTVFRVDPGIVAVEYRLESLQADFPALCSQVLLELVEISEWILIVGLVRQQVEHLTSRRYFIPIHCMSYVNQVRCVAMATTEGEELER